MMFSLAITVLIVSIVILILGGAMIADHENGKEPLFVFVIAAGICLLAFSITCIYFKGYNEGQKAAFEGKYSNPLLTELQNSQKQLELAEKRLRIMSKLTQEGTLSK